MTQNTITNDFEKYCEDITKKYQMPGLALGLAKDGKLFYEEGFGYRNVEKELPVTSDTVFGIGSVTKSFTCVAILQLQELGKLFVHDPVINFLPEFKTPNEEYTKQMTLHHFMTHSAGLPPLPTLFGALRKSIENDPKFDEDVKAEEKTDALDAKGDPEVPELPYIETYSELLENLAQAKYTLLGAPGTQFSYSNESYALLGIVIERVSGVPYEEYILENILKPAGMHNSVFHLEELSGHEDIATLYNLRKKEDETIVFESDNPWDAPPMRAAGFLKSTVNDMLKYAEIYRNQGNVGGIQILSPESVELMTTPYMQGEYKKYYGYGLMITPDFFGYKLVDHGGSIKGVAAQMNIIPELGLTGVSLTNLSGVPSTTILHNLFSNYLGHPIDACHLGIMEIDLSEEELKEYEGTFASGEGAKYEFHIEDGQLLLDAAGFEQTALKPFGDDWFLLHLNDMKFTLRFVRDSDKKINRLAFGFRQTPKVEEGSS